jgi:hypothetical protein
MMDDVRLKDLLAAELSDKTCYSPVYEILLRARRADVRVVLEIGIGTMIPGVHSSMKGWAADDYRPGASLRAWRRYFPGAEIIGVDVQPDTQVTEPGIRTFLCDSTAGSGVAALRRTGLKDTVCDVIIDDGSHTARDQLRTLANFFPMLASGGLYFIEDIGRGNVIYDDYRMVDRFVPGADYFEVADHNPANGKRWKMIVIQAPAEPSSGPDRSGAV